MKTTRWQDLKHKGTAEERERIGREALAEYDAKGFGAVRKAREMTQVELAQKLGIDQAGVSAMENRSDLLLSTLAKYIRGLGGDLQLRAVFPEMTFNLDPFPPAWLNEGKSVPAARSVRTVSAPPGARKQAVRRVAKV